MDTLTMLKTMRAVVADVEPKHFDMTDWFDRGANCGCVLGLTIASQPKFTAETGLGLDFGWFGGRRYARLTVCGAEYQEWREVARLTGLTAKEAAWLFGIQYKEPGGQHGKTEALKRLDELIVKYASVPDEVQADSVSA